MRSKTSYYHPGHLLSTSAYCYPRASSNYCYCHVLPHSQLLPTATYCYYAVPTTSTSVYDLQLLTTLTTSTSPTPPTPITSYFSTGCFLPPLPSPIPASHPEQEVSKPSRGQDCRHRAL